MREQRFSHPQSAKKVRALSRNRACATRKRIASFAFASPASMTARCGRAHAQRVREIVASMRIAMWKNRCKPRQCLRAGIARVVAPACVHACGVRCRCIARTCVQPTARARRK
jgi:hypothetical protein